MIRLTRIDGRWFFLNADLIETVEALPDTTITLINGKKYIVKESAEEVVQKVIEYKRKIFNWWKNQGR
ncbi:MULTISPECIES: flagellar FlbD family protein [Thermotoga]|jgi:flagellar protein FlbD|uniref:Flagellar FlbD family protein n=1 Tax=Thermotoga petrophila (strain ATCC BAA-488 / DSM 13995 / JCM 10881 / RKU-1) TaxID=390874 RepID=A5IJB2_THEP1|nr:MULTISPECIES: flagellar FlbD family protein [Thermotoga]MBZ4661386.1 flagellar FlbD family protein [Thermotoga sp.]ABQ46285.1 flagellar FlbD family protein [Thermotoga petrophila RKU-1]ACB08613.1 flagellar FlbD family protein [Thermotoga sp. RQ2]AIY87619.1 flagellar FlbD family protein [Thermotoga sp. Cell2]KHC92550.1 flagellar FlbD family protein [Thermotoga sp. TBGT1765]